MLKQFRKCSHWVSCEFGVWMLQTDMVIIVTELLDMHPKQRTTSGHEIIPFSWNCPSLLEFIILLITFKYVRMVVHTIWAILIFEHYCLVISVIVKSTELTGIIDYQTSLLPLLICNVYLKYPVIYTVSGKVMTRDRDKCCLHSPLSYWPIHILLMMPLSLSHEGKQCYEMTTMMAVNMGCSNGVRYVWKPICWAIILHAWMQTLHLPNNILSSNIFFLYSTK
jgi:hypothetical protein